MKKILSIVVMVGLLAIPAHATDNNTLHTFSSGETISSSKVNQNFVLVSNYVVKANNNIVGDFLGLNGSIISLITSNSYIVQINSMGEIAGKAIRYTDQQCDGDKYIFSSGAIFGEVFESYDDWEGDGTEQIVYVPKNAVSVNLTQYKKMGSGCSNYGNADMVKVLPNDQTITNVSGDFTAPILISK